MGASYLDFAMIFESYLVIFCIECPLDMHDAKLIWSHSIALAWLIFLQRCNLRFADEY